MHYFCSLVNSYVSILGLRPSWAKQVFPSLKEKFTFFFVVYTNFLLIKFFSANIKKTYNKWLKIFFCDSKDEAISCD